jgi:20S proteasome subunit beta 7
MRPIVTGTSVVALKFDGGVMMASDTLGSYGGLARFKNVVRITKAGDDGSIVGVGGDVSDSPMLKEILYDMKVEDRCSGDSMSSFEPRSLLTTLGRLLYHRRSNMNPLWTDVVVGGVDSDTNEVVLGTSDKIGTMYEDDYVATGFGAHLALPILRDLWKPNLSQGEAREILTKCMTVLYYRDCRTINSITFATTTPSKGAEISEPVVLDTKWDYPLFVDAQIV